MAQRRPWATGLVGLLVLTGLVLVGCDVGSDSADNAGGGGGAANRSFQATNPLTADEVRTIVAQAVTQAVDSGMRMTIAVTDRGGSVLEVFQMTGAREDTIIDGLAGTLGQGLEGITVPAALAAISKAGTAAFFATSGNAFTTRTASDIIQEHRPMGVRSTPGGPLFGVQFSHLPCTDIKNNPPLPLGLAGDPGGVPLYKNGEPVGAIGVEGDGVYSVDRDPFDNDQPVEELIAVAGARGFAAPAEIRADTILLDGVRLPFTNVAPPSVTPTLPFDNLPGSVIAVRLNAFSFFDGTIRATPDANFGFAHATLAGLAGRIAVDAQGNNRFPLRDSPSPGGLTAGEVQTIMTQAVQRAYHTRAAIRQPRDSFAQVNITVVDDNGIVLGYFGTPDAPFFGFDVAAQKARTAAFFSSSQAGPDLTAAGMTVFVAAAQHDGLALDGSIAFSNRGVGFLHRPFFPDGIDGTAPGPFSPPIAVWSPFNVGLQLALVRDTLLSILGGGPAQACTSIVGLENGLQIFAGSVPLFKNGLLVGAVGVSGDGIDQDDLVAAAGSAGFEAPPGRRSDQVTVRGVQLPFVKFPRNPEL
jgi:uncharacterized protein GlcG (DUF336 family)